MSRRECTVTRITTFVVPVNAASDAEAEIRALRILSTNLDERYVTEEAYNVVNIIPVEDKGRG